MDNTVSDVDDLAVMANLIAGLGYEFLNNMSFRGAEVQILVSHEYFEKVVDVKGMKGDVMSEMAANGGAYIHKVKIHRNVTLQAVEYV